MAPPGYFQSNYSATKSPNSPGFAEILSGFRDC